MASHLAAVANPRVLLVPAIKSTYGTNSRVHGIIPKLHWTRSSPISTEVEEVWSPKRHCPRRLVMPDNEGLLQQLDIDLCL